MVEERFLRGISLLDCIDHGVHTPPADSAVAKHESWKLSASGRVGI